MSQKRRGARGAALRRLLGGLALSLAVALPVYAQSEPALVPVIEAGREADILSLVLPYAPDGEIISGWTLSSISIERDSIVFVVEGPRAASATLRLRHLSQATASDTRSASFTLRLGPAVDAEDTGEAALALLVAAVQRNDAGVFWRRVGFEAEPGGAGQRLARQVYAWLTDGFLYLLIVAGFLVAVAWRELRELTPLLRWGVVGVVLLSGVVRLAIAVPISLQPWTFTRMPMVGGAVAGAPSLSALVGLFGGSFYLTTGYFWSCFVVATLTPLAVFVHVRHLTRDDLLALAAAGVLAVLPMHIRFSRSDTDLFDAFAAAALAFSFLYVALEDADRRWRVAATVVLAVPCVLLFGGRPLNVLFLPLLGWTALGLVRSDVPWARRALVSAVVLAVALATFLPSLEGYAEQASEGGAFSVVTLAARALVTPTNNSLIDPWVTPPLVLLLAVAGVAALWRRCGPQRVLFLLAWLFGFFAAASFVLSSEPVESARYHLRLLTPVVSLAAASLVTVHQWNRWAAAALALALLASPLLHIEFERDIGYDTVREFAFLEKLRPLVPKDCTVLEYLGPGPAGDERASRLERIGSLTWGGGQLDRWKVVSTGSPYPIPPDQGPVRREAREVLAAAPACLYLYQGTTCWGEKRPDEPIAPACAALRDELALTEVLAEDFASRPYNGNLASGYAPGGEQIELRLYRVDAAAR